MTRSFESSERFLNRAELQFNGVCVDSWKKRGRAEFNKVGADDSLRTQLSGFPSCMGFL